MQRYRVVIMLVLFGVLPVVVAFFVALSFLEEQEIESPPIAEAPVVEAEPPPPPPETREVFAAARALPVATLLGKADLTKIELELAIFDEKHHFPAPAKGSDGVSDGMTADDLRGYAVREAIAEGAPLTRASVVGPREKGFLAAVLRPGARAVTIGVGASTSHAGLIDPGDLVDVILSAELGLPIPHNCSLDFMKPLRYRGHHGDSKSGRAPPAGQSSPTSQPARRSRVARYQKPRAGGRPRL